MTPFCDLTYNELCRWLQNEGYKTIHASAVWDHFYRQGRSDFNIPGIPGKLAEDLEHCFSTSPVLTVEKRLTSSDGTEKFLFRCPDDLLVEAVFIPQGRRKTLCISSQVGCPFGCRFCATGAMGFRRNLTGAEIVSQILEAQRVLETRISNVVFMGMGEPLANLASVRKSLDILTHSRGLALPPRRVTLSTIGLLPELKSLIDDRFAVSLAISLHHSDQQQREKLMPGTRKHDLGDLLDLLRRYTRERNRLVLFEYLLLDGVNDSIDHAEALMNVLVGISARINLISFHPYDGAPYRPSPPERERAFYHHLQQSGASVLFRKSRGLDILAACGQLAGRS